jgi:hypothetical protein
MQCGSPFLCFGGVRARQIIETRGLSVIDVDFGDAANLDVYTPETVIAVGADLVQSMDIPAFDLQRIDVQIDYENVPRFHAHWRPLSAVGTDG